MTKIVTTEFDGNLVHFTADGWFNATDAAKRFGKRPNDWLQLPETVRYLAAMERKYGKIPYFKTKRGGDTRKSGIAQGTWLHPKLAVRFAQWLDVDFAVWCDEQIDGLIRGTASANDWQQAREEVSSRFKLVCDMLNLSRKAMGKSTQPHHYMNEAKLISWALTGQFELVSRNTLSAHELTLLERIEAQNAVLLGQGTSYEERKEALQTFASEERNRLALPSNDEMRRLSA